MNKSDSIDKLAAALHSAQDQLKYAKKDSSNPFFKSKYADLESVWDACRDALRDNGLAVSQLPISDGELVGVETVLMHVSGQYISNTCTVKTIKQDPQAAGSAITYLRRYALAGVLGIIQSDDDGNESSGRFIAIPGTNVANGTKVREEIMSSLESTTTYVPPFGKYKGISLSKIPINDLRAHKAEIMASIDEGKVTGNNLRLAELLILEINKVLK